MQTPRSLGSGRPLGIDARRQRITGPTRDVGQQASEASLALVVDRARHAHGRAPDPARRQTQDRRDGAAATADGSVGGNRVNLGGDAARHRRGTRDCDKWAVTAEKLLARDRESDTLRAATASLG